MSVYVTPGDTECMMKGCSEVWARSFDSEIGHLAMCPAHASDTETNWIGEFPLVEDTPPTTG